MLVRNVVAELEARAAAIPEMGGRRIGGWLRQWAAESRGAIVEVGCWLGAGTAQLALGARMSGQPIHTFDRWSVRLSEIPKAAPYGVHLQLHQDTLPMVRETLAPFGVPIHFHQGSAQSATWHGAPIGLFVLDTAKAAEPFAAVRSIFWPSLLPGAVIVLQDFHFYEQAGPKYRAQRTWMEAHADAFELLVDRIAGTCAAAFRWRGR